MISGEMICALLLRDRMIGIYMYLLYYCIIISVMILYCCSIYSSGELIFVCA